MDKEDLGKDNPRFQRYIPSCYRNRQRYIPSMYLMEKDGLPDKDTLAFYGTEVIDDVTYEFVKGRWRPQEKSSRTADERPSRIS